MITEPRPVPTEHPTLPGRLVAGNVGWNLLGQAAPILVAIICIPILARSLGVDRFGLLALSWTFVGYFSIFDLGLGQAMTRSIAAKLGTHEETSINVIVWTTLAVMLVLGTTGFAVAFAFAPAIIHALRIPPGLQQEGLRTVQLLAVSIPLVITNVGLRGILEAHLRFKLVNAVRIPLGMWTYVGPIIALSFSHSLVVIVGLLLLGRVAGSILYIGFALRVAPSLRSPAFRLAQVRPLLRFGGWLTLDNLIDPITSFLDRFLIGVLISVAAVAYYSVPFELATKAWAIPVALSGVLFPTFTRVIGRDRARARFFFRRGVKYLAFAMFPIALVTVSLAQPGLRIWIGPQFAERSAPVLELCAAAVLITSIGSLADTFIQSTGRPDVSARLAIAKFILHFAPALWVISSFGIVGLAALWLTTTTFEAAGMFVVALRMQGDGWRDVGRVALIPMPMFAALVVAAQPMPIGWKLGYTAAAISLLAVAAWRALLSPGERAMFRARLRTRTS